MSVKLMSLVWEHFPAGGSDLLTALAYADHAHDDGTSIRPSVAYIAKKTRQSERTVSRILARMREMKWLLTVRQGNGRGYASEYRINPLWITNPVNLSFEAERASRTVTPDVVDPDTGRAKKLTPVASQSPRIIKEPAGTAGSANDASAETLSNSLQWAPVFTNPDRRSAEKTLSAFSKEQRQALLDAVASIAEKTSVRSPLGLLKTMAARVQVIDAGSSPVAGLKEERMRVTPEPLAARSSAEDGQASNEVKKASLERLAALRQSISKKSPSKRTGRTG